MPTVRSCLVSFTDAEGIEHSIRVPAESLLSSLYPKQQLLGLTELKRCG